MHTHSYLWNSYDLVEPQQLLWGHSLSSKDEDSHSRHVKVPQRRVAVSSIAVHCCYATRPGGDRTFYPVPGPEFSHMWGRGDGWPRDRDKLRFGGYLVRLTWPARPIKSSSSPHFGLITSVRRTLAEFYRALAETAGARKAEVTQYGHCPPGAHETTEGLAKMPGPVQSVVTPAFRWRH